MYTAKYFDLISSGTIDWGIIFCETTLGGTISGGTKFETLKFEPNLIFFFQKTIFRIPKNIFRGYQKFISTLGLKFWRKVHKKKIEFSDFCEKFLEVHKILFEGNFFGIFTFGKKI